MHHACMGCILTASLACPNSNTLHYSNDPFLTVQESDNIHGYTVELLFSGHNGTYYYYFVQQSDFLRGC